MPLNAISIEVPKSGCEITNIIGKTNMVNGINKFLNLFTFVNCIRL